MTRTIRYQESKAERKREREKIGRLRDQRITPGTKDRYEAALQQVAAFAGVSVPRLLASSGLDDLLSSFIERLWEDGDTKTDDGQSEQEGESLDELLRQAKKAKLDPLWNLDHL